ncbi:unnamed protein product [Symbiodinium microadriaticum]|nr:unnamed protein product [Symbiodinium microadriaticum]
MALVDPSNPGGGILVDASAVGRPIGDTSSSAVFVNELPKNFQGGDEALHFALGQLFGQYGKIKKIELYMEEGILETQNFKGEALVVYHTSKFTGTHDAGDPVYEACRDMDGRVRVLGHRNWRIRCEAAVWQKEGFNVKDRAKKFPCVEIGNLWEYTSSTPMSWFMDIQEVIRKHVGEHIKEPFVKALMTIQPGVACRFKVSIRQKLQTFNPPTSGRETSRWERLNVFCNKRPISSSRHVECHAALLGGAFGALGMAEWQSIPSRRKPKALLLEGIRIQELKLKSDWSMDTGLIRLLDLTSRSGGGEDVPKFLAEFKTKECPKKERHGWKQCEYFHHQAKDRRRNPYKDPYLPEDEWNVTGVEKAYHPVIFRTQLCESLARGAKTCQYGSWCAFAHAVQQLREDPSVQYEALPI